MPLRRHVRSHSYPHRTSSHAKLPASTKPTAARTGAEARDPRTREGVARSTRKRTAAHSARAYHKAAGLPHPLTMCKPLNIPCGSRYDLIMCHSCTCIQVGQIWSSLLEDPTPELSPTPSSRLLLASLPPQPPLAYTAPIAGNGLKGGRTEGWYSLW
jgi:hypothetical protein